MKYYSIPNDGNSLLNFGLLNFIEIEPLVVKTVLLLTVISISFVITLYLWHKNKTIDLVYFIGFGICLALGLFFLVKLPTISSSSDGTYYTTSDDVSSWTNNSVYLLSQSDQSDYDNPDSWKVNEKKDVKLITRTPTKIYANTPSGAAYLRVTHYLVDHHQEINNVFISVGLNKTEATFDTVNGSQSIVSYATKKGEKAAEKRRTSLNALALAKGISKQKILYWMG